MEKSAKEQRVRRITNIYYSRPEIQQAIYEFSQNREVSPQYFEGFGKRPDSFQYPGDVFELAKKGATSFHCSEELWEDPLRISTNLSKEELDSLRKGWDLLIDIDCKWIEGSKKAALAIISALKKHRIKNIGLKFSGSKGFHIIVPWKAFPKQVGGEQTKNLFPELPRKLIEYLRSESEKELRNIIDDDFISMFSKTDIKKGIKCKTCSEISDEYSVLDLYCDKCRIGTQKKQKTEENGSLRCPECRRELAPKNAKTLYECKKCQKSSDNYPSNFSGTVEVDLFDLMGLDLILVSPRHLFRAPYSLHEKTALVSAVLDLKELENFDMKDADYLKVKVKNFMPDAEEGEASEFVLQALDWYSENKKEPDEKPSEKKQDFQPIKIDSLSDKMFPPSIQTILKGVDDGRKRALFILLNLFRSVGMERDEIEKRIYDWNKKNSVPLKEGYIKSQIAWSYRNKIVPPPNFEKDYYRAIGVTPTDEELRYKNPVNYIMKKYKSKSNN